MNKIFTVSIAHGPANEQCLVSFWRKRCYVDHVILSVLEGVLNYIGLDRVSSHFKTRFTVDNDQIPRIE
jgi:hypothetical protein